MFLKCLNVCENVKILSICYVVKINNFNVLLYFYIKYYCHKFNTSVNYYRCHDLLRTGWKV